MDSWENKTAIDAAWYYDANGGGNCREMDSGSEDGNVNVFNSDELTSWKTNGGC